MAACGSLGDAQALSGASRLWPCLRGAAEGQWGQGPGWFCRLAQRERAQVTESHSLHRRSCRGRFASHGPLLTKAGPSAQSLCGGTSPACRSLKRPPLVTWCCIEVGILPHPSFSICPSGPSQLITEPQSPWIQDRVERPRGHPVPQSEGSLPKREP